MQALQGRCRQKATARHLALEQEAVNPTPNGKKSTMKEAGDQSDFSPGTEAAHRFAESMFDKADRYNPAPMWYGWALREAFLAGVKWQQERDK
jgi:hypothetical protein